MAAMRKLPGVVSTIFVALVLVVVGATFMADGILAATNVLLTAALTAATVMLVAEGRAMREAQFAPASAVEVVLPPDSS